MYKISGKTTEKFVGGTESIRGHIFESTSFGQANQYQKTLKNIYEYAGANFNSNVRKSTETLKYQCLIYPTRQ